MKQGFSKMEQGFSKYVIYTMQKDNQYITRLAGVQYAGPDMAQNQKHITSFLILVLHDSTFLQLQTLVANGDITMFKNLLHSLLAVHKNYIVSSN